LIYSSTKPDSIPCCISIDLIYLPWSCSYG